MRIRRRDRGEAGRVPAVEATDPPVQPADDIVLTAVPSLPADDRETQAASSPDATPPPFDQALLSPTPASAPQPTQAPMRGSSPPVEAFVPVEPVVVPPVVVPRVEPVGRATEPILQQASRTPVTETAVTGVETENVVTQPTVAPEPASAPVPTPASAPPPASATAPVEEASSPQMRTPTIRSEADSLLDGSLPAPRELPA